MPHILKTHLVCLLCLLAAASLFDACSSSSSSDAPSSEAYVWESWPAPALTDIPRPEHPNPAFMRRDFANLNGEWEFSFDSDDEGLEQGWATTGKTFDRTITVPYSWISPLSGVGVDTGDEGGIGWYRRHFTLPSAFAGRQVLLVIGAADWDVSLFVNGQELARHATSGYLPVKQDITSALVSGENEIVVRVQDVGNDASYPHGKQGAPWYANVAGIWQTVYLEATGTSRFESISLAPDLASHAFRVEGHCTGALPADGCRVRAYAKDHEQVALFDQPLEGADFGGTLAVPWLEAWSPERPVLQDFEWRLDCGASSDVVRTYAGLRRVSRQKVAGQEHETIHLNDKPLYVSGVLVQGYNAQGTYTYPDAADIFADLQAAKDAGFNLVRLHIKTEEPLVLYQADKLGLLVDDDIPCYGKFPFASGDTPEARARWQALMEGQLQRDYNHPSIIWWTLFNEDWGFNTLVDAYNAEQQAFVKSMMARARELDDTRLIEDHSTLRFDHISGTDLNSFHIYQDDPAAFESEITKWEEGCYAGSSYNYADGETQDSAPLINAEYGPFSSEYLTAQWIRDRDISWGFRQLTTVMRRHPKLVGYVFTELYDVEFELNGFLDYDRTPKVFGYPQGISPADLNAADFVGFAEPSFQVEQGTTTLSVHPFVSSYGTGATDAAATLVLTLFDTNDTKKWEGSTAFVPQAASVVELAKQEIPLPTDLQGAAYVLAQWQDASGQMRARNFLPGESVAPKEEAVTCTANACRIRLDLAACSGASDDTSRASVAGELMAAGFIGAGALACPLTLPAELPADKTLSIHVEGEMAANVEGAPQTHQTGMTGGEVALSLDGLPLGSLALPPDRADSRGVLSQLNGSTPKGGYGDFLVSTPVAAQLVPAAASTLSFTATGTDANGFLLYGRRLGRYGKSPLLVIEW